MSYEPDYQRFIRDSVELHCVAGPDGKFRWVNGAWLDTLGWDQATLLSTPFLELIHPDDRESTLHELQRLDAGSATIGFRNRYRCRDGTWRWLEWFARPDGEVIYATARDVTELTEVRRLNARRLQSLEVAEELTHTGNWRLDLAGGTAEWSPQVYRIYGRDPAEGPPALAEGVDAYHPDDRHLVAACVSRAMETGQGFEFRARLLQPGGGTRLVHSVGRAELRAGTDEVIAIFGVFRDVTEDTQLREMNEQLEQFNYVVSHDLVEPLRTIRSHLGLLEELAGDRLEPGERRFLTYAVEGAARAQTLIDDLLTYTRLGQRGEPCEIDMSQLVDEIVDDLRARVDAEGATVEVAKLPWVTAEATPLRQIIGNLLSNALKFHREDTPPRIQVDAVSAPGQWRVSIRDNGIGIEADHLDKIFHPFQSLHPRGTHEGNGIGLSIVRRAAQQLGGRIEVESTPGVGSTFSFTLPRAH
ncbi:MAG: PAS domain-containing protein [Deltaproteobacteria bacterium]|nr:PAS domain-containing protein [Deltaproteobacteria bacterium]